MRTSGVLGRARRRELLIALQELAGQFDPLQFEILKVRIAFSNLHGCTRRGLLEAAARRALMGAAHAIKRFAALS
jgi:hypothetical protein